MRTCAVGFSLMLLAVPLEAQTAGDPRWTAWIGCWELVTDAVREAPPASESPLGGRREARRTSGRGARVCVAPAENGVVLRTLVGAEQVLEQTLVADGADRPISEPACRGTQRAEWSADGRRLFSHAELRCPNEAPRTVSGLALIAPNGSWVDVQAVTVDDRESVRVRRYRRAPDSPGSVRPDAPHRLTLADVKDAAAKVSPSALEAALIETSSTFGLTSRALLDLDEAGVPDSVVDLMVALTYPQAFSVERVSPEDRVEPIEAFPFAAGWAPGYPLWPYGYGSSFGYGFSDYYWSPYYYSPFGYAYLRSYPGYFGSGSLLVDPAQSGRPAPTPGRVIDGLGYTRVQPRQATTGDQGTETSGSRGGVSTQGFSRGGAAGGTSSSSGGSSSGSGSSGGGGGGRTAVER